MLRPLSFPLLVVAAGLLGQTALAAPTSSAPDRPNRMGNYNPTGQRRFPRGMGLGLTPAQEKKMVALMRASYPQRQAVMKSKLTPEQKRIKLQAIRMQFRSKMNAILTPTQRKKRDAMMKERRRMWQQRETENHAA